MKLASVLILLFAFQKVVTAQNIYLTGGLNYSTILTNDPTFSFRPGYYIAFGGKKELTEKISIVHEFMISHQGTHYTDNGEHMSLFYYNVPVLASYQINPRLSIELGPQVALLSTTMSSSLIENKRLLNLSISAGPHFQISERLFTRLRINGAIPKMYKNGDGLSNNLVLQCGVGYMLKKKQK